MQPPPAPIKAILYDLDGTLIDHFGAIHGAIAFAQQQLGLPPSSYEKVRATVGGGIELTLQRLLGPQLAPAALPLYLRHFDEIMLDHLCPLPGAASLLQQLHARGLRQAVLTNKIGASARTLLHHLGWDRWLELILGADDTPWRKPMPEFTRHALEKIAAAPEATILIGDSTFDIATAHNATLRCLAVATGSHTRDQLLANQPPPDAVFDDLVQLAAVTFQISP
ncbi:MAG: HAD-IA family hydrolase [Opitutales bacterium]